VNPDSLAAWLDYQQQVHQQGIALGLDRVRRVWRRLEAPRAPILLLVGGTNGKGSTVAFMEAILRAAGHRVGAYTSPHLLHYNERVRIDGVDASDAGLCAAFARIDAARGDIPLTYFEFGTLAALVLFAESGVEVGLLEVGLGGRLDATNIVDADVAVVTTVDMDHMDWLGDTRDAIGREKAGIARAGRPLVIGEAHPPEGLLRAALEAGAPTQRAGIDFTVEAVTDDGDWVWHGAGGRRIALPAPQLEAPCQRANAAAAIAALVALEPRLTLPDSAMVEGVAAARVSGRLQHLQGTPELIVDVAHNAQAARVLAQWLDRRGRRGRVLAVFGALADKDVAAVLAAIGERVDHWYLAGLEPFSPRGLPAEALASQLTQTLPRAVFTSCVEVADALQAAATDAAPGDLLLAFGSFFVVSAALAWHGTRSQSTPLAAV
jgi:dihydrofolate synthase / folylpolyglutamate synthase